MALWLFKEEPGTYCFADLQREGSTTWTGIKNALALKHLRQIKAGDRVFLYHTGKEKAIVGEMRVVSNSVTETEVAVVVEPVRILPRAVTLAEIKTDEKLATWDLIRLPRLSVMPVTEEQWRRVEELARPTK